MSANQKITRFPNYGWIGVLIIVVAEILLIADIRVVKIFFTPIAWTGYILFIDALLNRLGGTSYLIHRRKAFAFMLPVSLGGWLIFEAYNLHLRNWMYINLPENMAIRLFGYVWAFITIFPGILLTSEVIDSMGIFDSIRLKKFTISKMTLIFWILVGSLFLIIPIVLPRTLAQYLIVLVWIGFVPLLDPINAFLGEHSLFVDLREGKIGKLLSLFLAGIICGFLWEFWNYWATTKWIYTLPFLQRPKLFEMPLVGFLGFLPFAVECYVMWVFFKHFAQKVMKISPGKA